MTVDEKPANQLAERIVNRLITEGLIRSEKKDALATKIAAGTMREEDWNLEIELSGERESEK